MYNLLDLKFESRLTEENDEITKDEILSIYDKYFICNQKYVEVSDLEYIFNDTFYYVGVNYFVSKGKKYFYKGVIVLASKNNLIEYLVNVITKNDSRSIFIIPKNNRDMLLLLDDEGSLVLKSN